MKLKDDNTPAAKEEARRTLAKYGRFAEPVMKRIVRQTDDAALQKLIASLLKSNTQTARRN
jgi:hypothetical protein